MISVVIITKNSARTIQRTLYSLQKFSEIILYDNGSTDNTITLSSEFNNVKVIQGEFIGSGATKNKATTYANNNWILCINADEYINDTLYEEIMCQDLSNPLNVFTIKKDNYFDNKKIKYCGWGNEYLVRLYNKTKHSHKENLVQEYVELNALSINKKLRTSFSHDRIKNVNDFLEKMKLYTDIESYKKETKWILIPIFSFIFSFFKSYIIKLGFLEGYRGFFISWAYANVNFYTYFKRYLNYKKRAK